jgi:uncharacterized protein YpmB
MKSIKFEKLLKIISVITLILIVICFISGWIYSKKINSVAINENIEHSENKNDGSMETRNEIDIFKN